MKNLKQKLIGLGLILCGLIPTLIIGDGTALLFFGLIGLCLIFSRENYIYNTPTAKGDRRAK